jgi:hypothetical protein
MMPTTATHIWKPSDSRVVHLDAFVPLPRGGGVSSPAPLNWPAKDPRDVLDYQLDIAPALIGDEGDSIESIDVSIVPNNAGDLVTTSVAADGVRAVLWFAGGVAGVVYTVTIEITTANGRAIQRSILLPVLSLSNPHVPANAIETLDGIMLTDHNGNPILSSP